MSVLSGLGFLAKRPKNHRLCVTKAAVINPRGVIFRVKSHDFDYHSLSFTFHGR